ncbi:hypothetical protein [Nocardia goodfellowii]|uniref:DUF4229 domain-containing protein n=1 Tax=Nocardia goodfellowii TaxID=882446 RepID=A0ABS4QNC8_9NOCA|nr:hypothetical protein [Nocardia goodfellowii]MBP2193217.1 hypothetical protein [Nocardia goodfellowii]
MSRLVKLGFDLLLGDLLWFVIGGLILLVLAAYAWDVISVPVVWVLDRFRKDHGFDEQPEQVSHTGRTARTRERRAARDAERRAALRAKHADSGRVYADQTD